jgi:hypothetical protein
VSRNQAMAAGSLLARMAVPGTKLLARLAVPLATARRSRRRAIRSFRSALAETGLPPQAIEELAEVYPDLPLGDLISHRANREAEPEE